VLILSLLASVALADDPVGFYDEDSIAAASATFRRANDMAETFREAAARTGAVAAALTEYQVALDLLGPDAPASDRAALASLEASFAREQEALQGFVDETVDAFDGTFRAAMERALVAHPGEELRCEGRIAAAPPLPGLPVRTRENPDCAGADLNAAIAAAMDADPELEAAVDALLARPWPGITVAAEAGEAVGEGARAIPVLPFARHTLGGLLGDVARAQEEALLPVEAALEGDPDPAELERLRVRVDAIEAEVAARLGGAFAGVRAAAERAAAREGASLAWCARPEYLGGCALPAAPAAEVASLARDKRVAKAARKAR
jgi:hypothetical protein